MADYNSQSSNKYPPRNKRATGDFALYLKAETPLPGAVRQPSLCVYYHGNNVVVEVRTNQPSDMEGRDRGLIRAELAPHLFMLWVEAMHEVLKAPPTEGMHRLKLLRPDFRKVNDGKPVLDCQIAFGKSSDGVINISVLSSNRERPAIKFPILPTSKQIILHDANNKPYEPGPLSQMLTRAYLSVWTDLMKLCMHDHYAPKEFKRPGSESSNSNSGSDMRTEQKPTADTWAGVDDLPF